MTQMNLSTNRNRLTDIENRLAVAKGEENGGRMESEVAVTSRKLIYIGRINNKVPLHSTENYSQYPMINHNRKKYKK